MQENYDRIIEELRPIDSPFFKVLGKHEDFVKEITEAIIGRRIVIRNYETEASLQNIPGRSIAMDLYVRTADDIHINIEAENSKYRASPKRARLHNSSLDASITHKGQKYEQLQDVYIIFLTSKKVFKDDSFVYHIVRKLQESDEIFEDAVHIIYVNCMKADDSHLGEIAHDMLCSNPDDMINPVIRKLVREYKKKQEGEKYMCEIIDRYIETELKEKIEISRAEGRAEGKAEGRAEGKAEGKAKEKREIAKRLFEKGFSVIEIMEITGLSQKEIIGIKQLIH